MGGDGTVSQRTVHEKRTVEIQVDRKSTYCDCCQVEAPVRSDVLEADHDGSHYRHVTFEQDFTGWFRLTDFNRAGSINFFSFCPTCAQRIIQANVAGAGSL